MGRGLGKVQPQPDPRVALGPERHGVGGGTLCPISGSHCHPRLAGDPVSVQAGGPLASWNGPTASHSRPAMVLVCDALCTQCACRPSPPLPPLPSQGMHLPFLSRDRTPTLNSASLQTFPWTFPGPETRPQAPWLLQSLEAPLPGAGRTSRGRTGSRTLPPSTCALGSAAQDGPGSRQAPSTLPGEAKGDLFCL